MDKESVKLREILGLSDYDTDFPGMILKNLTRDRIDVLESGIYFFSPKIDGLRCLCLLYDRRLYFIDRNFYTHDVIECQYDMKYEGTVLDGEYVGDDEGVPTYVVFDCVSFGGVLGGKFEPDRGTGMVQSVMHLDNRTTDIVIVEQDFRNIYQLEKYFASSNFAKKIDANGLKTDGIVLMDINSKYKYGVSDRCFKWKPPSDSTADFYVGEKHEKWYDVLFLNADSSAIRKMDCLDTSKLMKVGCVECDDEEEELEEGQIVECRLSESNSVLDVDWVMAGGKAVVKWDFVRKREDKSFPNSRAVFEGVLETLRNPIVPGDLVHAVKNRDRQRIPLWADLPTTEDNKSSSDDCPDCFSGTFVEPVRDEFCLPEKKEMIDDIVETSRYEVEMEQNALVPPPPNLPTVNDIREDIYDDPCVDDGGGPRAFDVGGLRTSTANAPTRRSMRESSIIKTTPRRRRRNRKKKKVWTKEKQAKAKEKKKKKKVRGGRQSGKGKKKKKRYQGRGNRN